MLLRQDKDGVVSFCQHILFARLNFLGCTSRDTETLCTRIVIHPRMTSKGLRPPHPPSFTTSPSTLNPLCKCVQSLQEHRTQNKKTQRNRERTAAKAPKEVGDGDRYVCAYIRTVPPHYLPSPPPPKGTPTFLHCWVVPRPTNRTEQNRPKVRKRQDRNIVEPPDETLVRRKSI